MCVRPTARQAIAKQMPRGERRIDGFFNRLAIIVADDTHGVPSRHGRFGRSRASIDSLDRLIGFANRFSLITVQPSRLQPFDFYVGMGVQNKSAVGRDLKVGIGIDAFVPLPGR